MEVVFSYKAPPLLTSLLADGVLTFGCWGWWLSSFF